MISWRLVAAAAAVLWASGAGAQVGGGNDGGVRIAFDPERQVTLTGSAEQMVWQRPVATVYLSNSEGTVWGVVMDSPVPGRIINLAPAAAPRQIRAEGFVAIDGSACPLAPGFCVVASRVWDDTGRVVFEKDLLR